MSAAAARSPAPDAVALAGAIAAGECSAREACARALDAAVQAPQIVWELDAERATADAAAVDAAVEAGDAAALGPLAGVPVLVKDSIDVAGLPTRAGLPHTLHVAAADASVVAQLRAAGALVIGKAAMDELAWSMRGQAPGYPRLENPRAPGHLTGGSSGGSAAAVAAGIVPLTFGSDTAGSVRVPAAWCGVTAVKPSHGRISLDGVAPLAPSFDTIGVIARSARDCAAALAALGLDTSSDDEPCAVACAVLDDGVPPWWAATVASLFALDGWERAVALSELPEARFGRILAAEFAAAWPELTGATAEIIEAVARGAELDPALVSGDRTALAAARERAPARLGPARLLVLPTVSGPAPSLDDGVTVAEASRYTRTLSALGWPAASLPCGRVDGRPVGLQLAAAPGDDAFLLACLERAATAIDPEAERA